MPHIVKIPLAPRLHFVKYQNDDKPICPLRVKEKNPQNTNSEEVSRFSQIFIYNTAPFNPY